MSLRVFHIIFVTLSIALALGCGVWALQAYMSAGTSDYLLGVALSFGGAVLLALYLRRVVRKFKAMRGVQNMHTAN